MNKVPNKSGFSLVEAIVALAILSLVLVSVITMVGFSSGAFIDSGSLKDNAMNSYSAIEKGEGNNADGTVSFVINGKSMSVDGEYRVYGEGLSRYYVFEA